MFKTKIVKFISYGLLFAWVVTMDDGCAKFEQWHAERTAEHASAVFTSR